MMHDPTVKTPTARVLLVDDHSIVRTGLAALLAPTGRYAICGEAGAFDEARELTERLRPDAIVLDITLKDRNGLDLIPLARAANPAVKIVVLSMHDEADYAERALRAGAQGYVMKENADAVLVPALDTVLGGEVYVSPTVTARVLRGVTEGVAADEPRGVAALTARERDVFACIGRGLTSRKIAEELVLSARTVEVHRGNIKRKLGCEDAAQVVREAVRWLAGEHA